MEFKISIRKDIHVSEETLAISTGNQAIVIDGHQQYALKTKRYIVDQILKRYIPDTFVDAKVRVDNHTVITATPQTQPTGEKSVVIKKFTDNGYIEDEYIFIEEKCVFNNGEEIPESVSMGQILREYMEDIFFPKTTK